MQQPTSSLEDDGFVRALAFVESLACAKPAVILEIARTTVIDESRTALVKSLDAALVAAARAVGAWHVKDAVRTALHPLQRLALVNDAHAREVRIAYQLACEAALALLAGCTISPDAANELYRPFDSLAGIDEVETPSAKASRTARSTPCVIESARSVPARSISRT